MTRTLTHEKLDSRKGLFYFRGTGLDWKSKLPDKNEINKIFSVLSIALYGYSFQV